MDVPNNSYCCNIRNRTRLQVKELDDITDLVSSTITYPLFTGVE